MLSSLYRASILVLLVSGPDRDQANVIATIAFNSGYLIDRDFNEFLSFQDLDSYRSFAACPTKKVVHKMSIFGSNAKDSKRVVPPSLIFINNQPGNSLFNILNPLSLSSTADSLSLAHQVEEKKEQQNSSYHATLPRIPLFIEYFMYNQDNEYTVYNVNHEFSYLVEQVRAEIASSSLPLSAPLASGTAFLHDSEKVVVLIEFDLEKIETTLCNVDMLARDFGSSSTCYFGFVLMVDHHVAKYGGDEEKLDYIQQLVRSLALRGKYSSSLKYEAQAKETHPIFYF